MKRTTTSIKDLENTDNVATPHEIRGGKLVTMDYDDVDGIAPAAALNSCVVDVAQWLRLNLGGGLSGCQIDLLRRTSRSFSKVQARMKVPAKSRRANL